MYATRVYTHDQAVKVLVYIFEDTYISKSKRLAENNKNDTKEII